MFVAAAARTVLAVGVALPTVHDISMAFRDTNCSAAFVSLLCNPVLPLRVLVAACRGAGFKVGTEEGVVAFEDAGGVAALVRRISLHEPSVVIAACGALHDLDPYFESEGAMTTAMEDAGHAGGGGAGSASLCVILFGELGGIDEVLVAA